MFVVGIQFTSIQIFLGGIWVVVSWVLIVDTLVDDMADVVDMTNLDLPLGVISIF